MATSAMKAIILFSLLQASVAVCHADSESCNVEEQQEMMKQLDVEEPSLNMLQMQARQASNTASASAEIHTSGSDETTMPTPDYYGFDEAGHYVGTEAGAEEEDKEGDEAAEFLEVVAKDDEAAEVPEAIAKDDDSATPLSAVQAGEKEMDGSLKWFEATTAETAKGAGFCEARGLQLCTYSQICPSGPGPDHSKHSGDYYNRVTKGARAGDHWAPYKGDGGNNWVQVGKWDHEGHCGTRCGPKGTTDIGTTCVKHQDLWHGHYGKPSWGNTADQAPSIRGWIACCAAQAPPCVDTYSPGRFPTTGPRDWQYSLTGDGCEDGTIPDYTRPANGCCLSNYVAIRGQQCKTSNGLSTATEHNPATWDPWRKQCFRLCDKNPSCTGIQMCKTEQCRPHQCRLYFQTLSKQAGEDVGKEILHGNDDPESRDTTCYVKKVPTTTVRTKAGLKAVAQR